MLFINDVSFRAIAATMAPVGYLFVALHYGGFVLLRVKA